MLLVKAVVIIFSLLHTRQINTNFGEPSEQFSDVHIHPSGLLQFQFKALFSLWWRGCSIALVISRIVELFTFLQTMASSDTQALLCYPLFEMRNPKL